eukprot:CCRYP_001454-RA/>CCRYP_001454-RA protein AED:0.05 eAED:0.05 QI:180/1/1/1/1/1/3/622/196
MMIFLNTVLIGLFVLPRSLAFNSIAVAATRNKNRTSKSNVAGKVAPIMASPSGGDMNSNTSVQRPPPRRTLKKRKNRRREKMDQIFNKSNINNRIEQEEEYEIETRPIRRRDAVEAGLDYWIDESDLAKERERKIAVRNRKAMEGEISRDRLREEVVAPYKQNWIGIFSVIIIILSTIATKFPEVMQIPVIQIPDL